MASSSPTSISALAGDIKKFEITSKSGITIDITGAIAEFFFYESILANTVSATIVVIDTGFQASSNSKRIRSSGFVNDLELSGGEKVDFELFDNNPTSDKNTGRLTSKLKSSSFDGMVIKTIRDMDNSSKKKMYVIDIVSKEHFTNEETRITKRYDGNPKEHVESILQDVLGINSDGIDIEKSKYNYNFIGNTKKPLYTCTWLASKSSPVSTGKDGKSTDDVTAGFLFYQTRDKYYFKSIDSFATQNPSMKMLYNNTGKLNRDGEFKNNILTYTLKKQIEVSKDLSLGVYNNNAIYFDFYSLNYRVRNQNTKNKTEVELLNREATTPTEDYVTEKPTRLMLRMLDVGTLPYGTTTKEQLKEWKKNPEEPTFQAEKIMAQSIMRYNEMFRTQVNIIIPGDFSIKAGDIIDCVFMDLNIGKKESEELSGNFLVANVCHKLNPTETFTSIDLVKDSKFAKRDSNNSLISIR